MGWAKNGQPAGSTGAGRQLEGIQVRLVPKNSLTLPGGAFYNPANVPVPDDYSLSYAAHVSYVGWQPVVSQGVMAGTTGRSRAVEALRLAGISTPYGPATINCAAQSDHAAFTPDTALSPDAICGTTGQKKSLTAIKLTLDAETAKYYDIVYRVHLSWVGWQEWKKNGEIAGNRPASHIEAITLKLVKK